MYTCLQKHCHFSAILLFKQTVKKYTRKQLPFLVQFFFTLVFTEQN